MSHNENPGIRQLNLKQHFHECIDWETVVVIDTADEFKEVQRQVGTGNCVMTSDELVLSWVKFVKQNMTWELARIHCQSIQGRLFFDIDQDQTTGKLDMLFDKLDSRNNWIGMYKNVNDPQWFNSRDEPIDVTKFKWGKGRPEHVGYAKAYNRFTKNAEHKYLTDTNGNWEFYFACDLRDN